MFLLPSLSPSLISMSLIRLRQHFSPALVFFHHFSLPCSQSGPLVNQITQALVALSLSLYVCPIPSVSSFPSPLVFTLCVWRSDVSVAKATCHLKHWWGLYGSACCRWAWRGLSGSPRLIPARWNGHLPPSHRQTAWSYREKTRMNNRSPRTH